MTRHDKPYLSDYIDEFGNDRPLEYERCRHCRGSGRVSLSEAFAGVCQCCIGTGRCPADKQCPCHK